MGWLDNDVDERALEAARKAQWETWISPSAAITLFRQRSILKAAAIRTLRKALQHNRVAALADTVAVGTSPNINKLMFYSVPIEWWKGIAEESDLWSTGTVTLNVLWRTGTGSQHVALTNVFGVRFDPTHVMSLLPSTIPSPPEHETGPIAAPVVPPNSNPASANTGKPVPLSWLRDWYAIFKKIHGGTPRDTDEFAMGLAVQMFPDHSISRSRFRKARGSKSRGRRPTKGNEPAN